MRSPFRNCLTLPALALALAGCGSDDSSTTPDASSPVDCSAATTQIDKAVCQAEGFLATLSTSEQATANPSFSDSVARTRWSNLPGAARSGIKLGALTASQQAAALALMSTLLSSDGMADLTGVRAADDYLGTMGGGGGGGQYAAANYYVAVHGTPSTTGAWAVMFGGHHMAYNIAFSGGTAHPIPNHLGVEPKSSFTVSGTTYEPMTAEGNAMKAVFDALSPAERVTAFLNQSFSDVLVGPLEYGTGSSAAVKAKYPTGANRTGALVSNLSAAQQALVTAAIEQWVADYDSTTAASLLAAYTSASAYQDTYVAWGGPSSAAVDVDQNGTYMRIDGPRVWIELSCQSGVVIQGMTHYHSIYRDKTDDYAGAL